MAGLAAVAVPVVPEGESTPAIWNGVVSEEKLTLIRSTFAKIADTIGALGFAKEFYTVLFEVAPQAEALFKSGRGHQSNLFANMLTTLITNADDADKVVPVLNSLAERHVRYGVQEPHFALVGAGWLATLEKVLGPDFTPPVREAWTELYGIVAKVMWTKMEAVMQEKAAA